LKEVCSEMCDKNKENYEVIKQKKGSINEDESERNKRNNMWNRREKWIQ
jgi:hypothetical protein